MRGWLPPLIALAARYGAGRVQRATLDTLGFPAGLITGGHEVMQVRRFLETLEGG